MPDVDWVDFILKLGAVSSAATGVVRLIIGFYKKYITDPYNNIAQKMQNENNRNMQDSITPLTSAIDRLNHLLEDSQADRKIIHGKIDMQEDIVDNHEIRITVLEDWRKGDRNGK